MQNAPLISLSRQIALRQQMDVVANNMANINTDGYKSEDILFEQYMMPSARADAMPYGDRQVYYTQDWATTHNFTPGAFEQTGNPFDIALDGPGFLSVETPAGTRYTKAGALHLNADGTLVTGEGYPVLGQGGPITFQPEDTDVTIAANGAVLTSQGNKGQLQLTEFANPEALTRQGSNLYEAPQGTGQAAAETTIKQGVLEKSNVSGVTEMTNMIQVNRAYQMLSQIIEHQNDLQKTAIEKLGSLSA